VLYLSRLRLLSLFFHTIRYKGITLAASAIIIFFILDRCDAKSVYLNSYQVLSRDQNEYYLQKKMENEDRVNMLLKVLEENERKQIYRLNRQLDDTPLHNVGLRTIVSNKIQRVKDYGQYRKARLNNGRVMTMDKKQVAVGILKIEE
jgi:hypothetical protein